MGGTFFTPIDTQAIGRVQDWDLQRLGSPALCREGGGISLRFPCLSGVVCNYSAATQKTNRAPSAYTEVTYLLGITHGLVAMRGYCK